jgi:hypothetical protein
MASGRRHGHGEDRHRHGVGPVAVRFPRDASQAILAEVRGRFLQVCAMLAFALATHAACSSFDTADDRVIDSAEGGADSGDGGTAEAQACTPPSCGGPGGRCGLVKACDLEFSCGECAAPYACVEGSCRCAGASDTCAKQSATCGELDDGCGTSANCGGCDAGTSCQRLDGGLACATGACVPEAPDITCKGKCNTATNNCGSSVKCSSTCADSKLCGADGKASSCSCPPRQLPINQFYDSSTGKFCYSQALACPGVAFPGTIATTYAITTSELVALYRCRHVISTTASYYLLTTAPNCENPAAFYNEGVIGACAKTPLCGAVPLYRHFTSLNGGNLVHSFDPNPPPNYAPLGMACYVWKP